MFRRNKEKGSFSRDTIVPEEVLKTQAAKMRPKLREAGFVFEEEVTAFPETIHSFAKIPGDLLAKAGLAPDEETRILRMLVEVRQGLNEIVTSCLQSVATDGTFRNINPEYTASYRLTSEFLFKILSNLEAKTGFSKHSLVMSIISHLALDTTKPVGEEGIHPELSMILLFNFPQVIQSLVNEENKLTTADVLDAVFFAFCVEKYSANNIKTEADFEKLLRSREGFSAGGLANYDGTIHNTHQKVKTHWKLFRARAVLQGISAGCALYGLGRPEILTDLKPVWGIIVIALFLRDAWVIERFQAFYEQINIHELVHRMSMSVRNTKNGVVAKSGLNRYKT